MNRQVWGVWVAIIIIIMVQTKNSEKDSISGDKCIFQQLIETVKRNGYALYSGKNVLELPLYFSLGFSFEDNFKNFTSQYLQLLKHNKVDSKSIKDVEILTKELMDTVNMYLNGKVNSAYSSFKDAMEIVKGILPIKTIHNRTFYRMRADGGIKEKNEFYHLPFNKIHLSKSERFSIEGYPCLYLGYSKHVCEIEISSGSLAKFVLKEPLYNILDLTLGQGDGKNDILGIDLVKVFPLIACCYIVPFYSVIQEKECRPDKSFFREEYIIPQLLTLYLKEEGIAEGIIYYSVKDPNLDIHGSGEKDYRNLVLFTNRDNNNEYDKMLLDKFNIEL